MRGTGNLDDTPHQEGRQRVGEHAADDGLSTISIGSAPIEQRRDSETEHEKLIVMPACAGATPSAAPVAARADRREREIRAHYVRL